MITCWNAIVQFYCYSWNRTNIRIIGREQMIRKPCWQGLCGNIAQALLWNLSTCIRRLCRNFHIVGRAASLSVSQFAFIVCPVSAIQQSTMAMKYNSSQCLRTKRNKHNNASTNVPFLPAILLLKLFALHIFFFLFCYHFFFLSILSVRRWYLCLFCITLEYEKKIVCNQTKTEE